MDFFFWTALSVGFLGSFHCAGMCGPLAMALPGAAGRLGPLLTGRLAYNFGRVVTYSILGTGAGLLGHTFSLRGWQSDLSIISGIFIILVVLFSNKKILNLINSKLVGTSFFLKKKLGNLLKRHTYGSLFAIGLLNGILPCGFVYLALAGAATTQGPGEGTLYMFLFGLGTIPLMLTMALSGSFISLKARNMVNRFTPVIALALALFLIQRGQLMKANAHDCCRPDHQLSSVHSAN